MYFRKFGIQGIKAFIGIQPLFVFDGERMLQCVVTGSELCYLLCYVHELIAKRVIVIWYDIKKYIELQTDKIDLGENTTTTCTDKVKKY